ncbi:hypothetical protein LEP1GSC005_1139 [Leptospira santarosai str. ST188]|nr:hypothetical protein LEP1GSC005_1139 [Leptospira santarosai str. ST188]
MLYSKDLLEADSSSFSAKKEKSFKNTDGISEQDSDDRTKRYREEFISLSIHKCASKPLGKHPHKSSPIVSNIVVQRRCNFSRNRSQIRVRLET